MKLVIIIGNTAVGKMTVGQELMKITDLRLFHNHMTIEPVLEIFGEFKGELVSRLRNVIFEFFADSSKYGLIFTYMWAFDQKSDWDYIQNLNDSFESKGAEVYYVELVTSQAVRIQRNHTENRLRNKASKQDIKASELRLLQDDVNYRCESKDGEIPFKNYIKIDNTDISAEMTAKQIKDYFAL